jgi:hypothetical protein
MTKLWLAVKRTLACCVSVCLASGALLPGIAAACEGGGGGTGRIQATPEPPIALKFSGKTTNKIKVENIGTAPVKFVSEAITFGSPEFAITKACEDASKKVVTELAVGAKCESTVEHANATKGQLGTWILKWNGGGIEEKSRVELESV